MKKTPPLKVQFSGIFVVSLGFFVAFNPYNLKVYYYVLPFMFLGLLVYLGLIMVLKKLPHSTNSVKERFIAIVGSLCVLVSLALSSLGQFDVADVLAILLLACAATVYIRKIDLIT